MKAISNKIMIMLAVILALSSCDNEDYDLNPEIVEMGTLASPADNETVLLDTENDERVIFSWTLAKSADGGAISYRILFDEQGGDFQDPLFSAVSDNGGSSPSYTASAARLNVMAAEAGIPQLETGNIIWTVEAISSYHREQFGTSSIVQLSRPEGLAIFPEFMYIYGSATESANIENAIAFKEISSQLPNQDIQPGVFESITKLTPGEFYIANSDDTNEEDFTYYYVNDQGKIRIGEQPSTFNMEEGVYRVRMNLSQATISFSKISNIQLYIMANQEVKADLAYVGNHTFESTNGYFDFLVPGGPGAPDWLGGEEERYRFMFTLGEQTSYIGSFHTDDMNGSLVQGLNAYNVRPNGGEPDYYYNVYFLGPDAGYWQGAWKFPDELNGKSFTVRIVFDPKADHYYHELEIN
ncbi:SusE domain-containing protein [Autumnicola musiva]|uniref:SusE domain-containing protein n=1 Tax=Autumnicola musiva TaxID=3075589 RepID=A0ABU3DAA6_9FLAO|nr:SusE domain-containing protein [Zunongwangia sp. F117]MDT0677883.1 SusE domain-containing protein [Zunongwangia sp. F117]